jgi:hypothetical protein
VGARQIEVAKIPIDSLNELVVYAEAASDERRAHVVEVAKACVATFRKRP